MERAIYRVHQLLCIGGLICPSELIFQELLSLIIVRDTL